MKRIICLLGLSRLLWAEPPPPWSGLPEQIRLNQQTVRVAATLWNEHSPGLSADERRTRARFELKPAVAGARITRFWAQQGKETWASALVLGRPDNGPYWKDGADVRLTLQIDYQGKAYYLRARTQLNPRKGPESKGGGEPVAHPEGSGK